MVVTPDKRQQSCGYNGLPRNVPDDLDLLQDVEQKNLLMVHAEANALLNAPFDTKDCTMYVTKFPCVSHGCSQAIIQAGIVRLVTSTIDQASKWFEDQRTGLYLLQKAGIEVDTINP